eukprot:CAMPEP_0198289030 /NCGR_PEP_ID=MMETSP1449-20131203/7359_1 /TAXON_ID=420275 /ORGANISM="Attheya septentrionalis, Strain CCMP2084" /LENGTH=273 /DNA_ID=CAMNT_0043987295 /DNA_START=121 /DNA_END=942 /DNA_ORIENTATION=+
MTRSTARKSLALMMAIISAALMDRVEAYPIIGEVQEGEDKCFNFNIPEDDDAHMIFVAFPDDHDNDEVEDWIVSKMAEATHKGGKEFLPDEKIFEKGMPNGVKEAMENEEKSEVYLKVQKPHQPVLLRKMFKWFEPIVIRNVVKTGAEDGQGWELPLGGYSICFDNVGESFAKIVFDVVLYSDEGQKEEAKRVLKKEHLTPLEENFQESIETATSILNEMRYMEKREKRMRHTADSTNVRIRYFSYISVAVLLGVTWLQVTYLKSYFKKKKVL